MIRLALLLSATVAGATADTTQMSFVACPIYRDTDNGRKSGCWLADEPVSGVRYDITAAPTKPDWNRAVLVEGRIAAGAADLCGGRVLEPARVSVLAEPCIRHRLPAEGYKGRRFALPERNVRPLYEPRTPPTKPYAVGRFTVPFDFEGTFVAYQLADYYVDQAIDYALAVQPAEVVIAGHAQASPRTISGRRLVESPGLARERAELVAHAFTLRGVSPARIRMAEPSAAPFVAAAFDGLEAAEDRRVDILVRPLPAAKPTDASGK